MLSRILTLEFAAGAYISELTPVLHLADEPNTDYHPGNRAEFLLNYITAGRLTVLLNGQRETVGEGTFWIDAPGAACGQCAVPGQRYSIFHCHFKVVNARPVLRSPRAALSIKNTAKTLLLPVIPGSGADRELRATGGGSTCPHAGT